MKRQESGEGWVVGVAVGGTALVSGVLLALATWPRMARRTVGLPSDDWQIMPAFTEADVEAAARMLASENPRGSRALHIELIHSQLRACKPGQSLYDRITAGSGWGPQGERQAGGKIRPVSTAQDTSFGLRQLAREVLAGLHPSGLPKARKFFEPAQQDRAFAIAEQARKKLALGQPITSNEKRLLGYRHTAAEIRRKWLSEGAKHIGTVDGVEFYS